MVKCHKKDRTISLAETHGFTQIFVICIYIGFIFVIGILNIIRIRRAIIYSQFLFIWDIYWMINRNKIDI